MVPKKPLLKTKYAFFNLILRVVLKGCFYLLCLSVLTSFFVHSIPGEPVDILLGDGATETARAQFLQDFDLQKTFFERCQWQFLSYIRFDFGDSIFFSKRVSTLIFERASYSFYLAFFSTLLSLVLTIVILLLSAQKPFISKRFSIFSGVLLCFPSFLLALLVTFFFSYFFDLLPVAGFSTPLHFIAPILVLALSMTSLSLRRLLPLSRVLEKEDYIRTARSKGLSSTNVAQRHLLPNLAVQILEGYTHSFASLLSGAVVVESIFEIPGLGLLFYDSLMLRDYPLTHGLIFLSTMIFFLMNVVAEFFYKRLDPRLRSMC